MDLVTWRTENGLTQAQLARELGCGQPAISLLEKGRRRRPSAALMREIVRVTGGAVTPNDFFEINP